MTPWGRGGLKKIVEGAAVKLAKNVSKEDFLHQLEEAWAPYVSRTANIEEELGKAQKRIQHSGPFKQALERLDITDSDLRRVLVNIQEVKPETFQREERKTGRNDSCPCGSGKKHKHCCGG